MLVPVVLVLLLLRSAVAVVARILLAFWGRHVASVHARNQEVSGTSSIELMRLRDRGASRRHSPRGSSSPRKIAFPLCCKAWPNPRAARKVGPTRWRRPTSDGRGDDANGSGCPFATGDVPD